MNHQVMTLLLPYPYFPPVCLLSFKACPNWYAMIEKDSVSIFLKDSSLTTDVLLKGPDKRISDSLDIQPLCLILAGIFFCIFPHFLFFCVTVITFIFEYELEIPLFQFSLFFSELIPSRSLALPLSCHCQCLLSGRVWFQLQSQRKNAYAPLPPPASFLPTQCSTSPALPHLNSC